MPVRAAGAHVIGAARGEAKLTSARKLGADAAVDYTQEGWLEQVRALTAGRGPDLVLDGVGGHIGRASLDLTARSGRFIGYGAPSGQFTQPVPSGTGRQTARMLSLFDLQMAAGDDKRLTELALGQTATGRIKPIVGQTFPLDQDAHTAIENRTATGKILLLT